MVRINRRICAILWVSCHFSNISNIIIQSKKTCKTRGLFWFFMSTFLCATWLFGTELDLKMYQSLAHPSVLLLHFQIYFLFFGREIKRKINERKEGIGRVSQRLGSRHWKFNFEEVWNKSKFYCSALSLSHCLISNSIPLCLHSSLSLFLSQIPYSYLSSSFIWVCNIMELPNGTLLFH